MAWQLDELHIRGEPASWRSLAAGDPRALAREVVALEEALTAWRGGVISLIPSENVISDGALKLLNSDLAGRVSLGPPGQKIFPPGAANGIVSEIEFALAAVAGELVDAAFVDCRPQGVAMANAVVITALANRGDVLMGPSGPGGGNESYNPGSVPDLIGMRFVELPMTPMFDVDVDRAVAAIQRERPRLLFIGGMKVLKPYSLSEISAAAREVGAIIVYDAAHLVPLLCKGGFQNPLAEGADIVTFGSHKMLGGPIGGFIATNDEELAARCASSVYPMFLQSRDLNKYAASAYALAEMVAYGREYSVRCVTNARALAACLAESGMSPLCDEDGFTSTHQVIVDVSSLRSGARVAEACCDAGVLVTSATLLTDDPRHSRSGIRLSVQEPSRRGMTEPEMRRIADLITAAVAAKDPKSLRAQVRELAEAHAEVQFSF